jgi:N-acetylated-alpha-linked acidic dipeptidase
MTSSVSIGTDLEQRIQDACRIDDAWGFVEHAMTTVRLSGSDDEERSIRYLTERLDQWGVDYQAYRPTTFISWPLKATLRVVGQDGFSVTAKNPSMSVSTNGVEQEADLVYLPTGYAKDVTDIFSTGEIADVDISGKVVITEGLPMPAKVEELTSRGAVAAVFVGPGERIHEGICTTIWGSPDLDTLDRQPRIPILAVNRSEGDNLIECAKASGARVAFSTNLDTRWRQIPVLEATIPGKVLSDEFILLHAHLDSWHFGIGDNATGDALLLELVRVFQQFQNELVRTIKIVWWSGHSHGRYAGSTWYADTFAIDLAENCVAQINCDSPGCRWATTYTNVMWHEEAEGLAAQTIRDVTGVDPTWARPLRAGDYSFFNLGITGFFMLSSTMTEEHREELGYYPVGGCGGNIAWHTEDDVLEIADRDTLIRDIRLYATALIRAANAAVPPFDFRRTAASIAGTLAKYQDTAGDRFEFSLALREVDRLNDALSRFYERIEGLDGIEPTDERARSATGTLIGLGRLLIPVNYAREGRFHQDPAENIPALPDLAPVQTLAAAEPGSHRYHAAQISLQRGVNRLIFALRRATDLVEGRGVVVE